MVTHSIGMIQFNTYSVLLIQVKTNQPRFENHTYAMLKAKIQEAETKDAPARNEPEIHTSSPKATPEPFICTTPVKKKHHSTERLLH